jgi:glycosyltransferase involved in cell wall biosynthesis
VPSFWRLNLCACLARLFVRGPKLALWEHSPPSRIAHTPNWLYFLTASLFYQAATKVIAVSDGVAADIKGITIGLGRKIVTVYNAIPAPPQPSANRLEGPRRRIIWVGRLAHPKNPALMIEAFARLPRGEGYSLDILGDGQQRDDLEKRVLELGLADRVRFLGFQADVYAHLAAAHLLVLSSDREGLGNVLVEALNAGLSIVSTDCGEGVHEILQDGTYGTIVPVNDPRAMAEAIESEAGRERDPGFQRTGGARFDPPYVAERFLSALGLG